MILSIDVGIRNLAMCLLNETNNLVEEWDVSGVPPEHKDGIYVSLRKHLDERPWVLTAQTILIEKQPDRNKKTTRSPMLRDLGSRSISKERRLQLRDAKSLFDQVPQMPTGWTHSSSQRRKMIWQTLSFKLSVLSIG
jgi:hypothetical protein